MSNSRPKVRRTLYTVAGRHWIDRPGAYRNGRYVPISERGYLTDWQILHSGLTRTEAKRLVAAPWGFAEIDFRAGGRAAFGRK